jgi:hypothetical protein
LEFLGGMIFGTILGVSYTIYQGKRDEKRWGSC